MLSKFKGEALKGLTYEPLFPYFAHLKAQGAFKVCTDGYVTADSGVGIVHQAPAFGECVQAPGCAVLWVAALWVVVWMASCLLGCWLATSCHLCTAPCTIRPAYPSLPLLPLPPTSPPPSPCVCLCPQVRMITGSAWPTE